MSTGILIMTFMKKAKPYFLMVCLQIGSARMYRISMATLNHGMYCHILIAYRNAIAALVLSPFAHLLERKIRSKMTFSVFLQIITLRFLEPILDQGFTCMGMKFTSASFAFATMNAVPSVTSKSGLSHEHWLAGTALILVGCIAWSCFYVLQSITIKKYQAELSLSSLMWLAGALQSLAIALIVERHPKGWDSRLFAPLYTGMVSSGIAYHVQGLVLKERGPVFVTVFNPLCTIMVAVHGLVLPFLASSFTLEVS
ncbi:hypothetical protein SLE2022_032360 [Rubroshorea leprosula]